MKKYIFSQLYTMFMVYYDTSQIAVQHTNITLSFVTITVEKVQVGHQELTAQYYEEPTPKFQL